MQVRIFESENMDSALRQIKETLGPDALILSSRTVRKGGMGLFGKPVLEVTAAIDPANENSTNREGSSDGNANRSAILDNREQDDELSYQELWKRDEDSGAGITRPNPYVTERPRPREQLRGARFEKILQDGQQTLGDVHGVRSYDNKSLSDLHSEVGELRNLITGLVNGLPAQIEKAAQSKSQPIFLPTTNAVASHQSAHNQPILDALTKLGIEAEAAQTISHYAASQLNSKQIGDPATLNAFFGKTIAELVQTTGEILPELGCKKRLALIGPTGVGKTTTIAKLAAAYLLMGGKKVAMVTIDTYRIAAVEQLKVYGEIMNLPVEVVISPAQLSEVLQRHSNKDLVLIDTAGRSPKDDVSLNELQDFLAVDADIHLVLSATTRERDLYETSRRFSALEPKSLLMTKLDECSSLGVLLNVHLRNNCPLSYLANGQKVPEDLVQANAELVSALILEHSEG